MVKISQDQIRESIRASAGAEVQSAQEEIDRVLQARIETWEEFLLISDKAACRPSSRGTWVTAVDCVGCVGSLSSCKEGCFLRDDCLWRSMMTFGTFAVREEVDLDG